MHYKQRLLDAQRQRELSQKARTYHLVRDLYQDEAYREENSLLNKLRRSLNELVNGDYRQSDNPYRQSVKRQLRSQS